MERVLEPELMDDPEQAAVYAKADLVEENQGFVNRFIEYYPDDTPTLPPLNAPALPPGAKPATTPAAAPAPAPEVEVSPQR